MGFFSKSFESKQPAPLCAIHPDDKALITNENVLWWNGLSLDDCKAFEQQDNITKVAALQRFMEVDGLLEQDAAQRVRLTFPYYYLALEQRSQERFPILEADAKLPYVLKDRVNLALMSRKIDSAKLSGSSSLNALVREMIISGKI